jgi:hypothetical protein
MPHTLVECYHYFEGTYCFHYQGRRTDDRRTEVSFMRAKRYILSDHKIIMKVRTINSINNHIYIIQKKWAGGITLTE